jgi:hypothetical protein
LWENKSFYYSNEGLKKNKTSEINYDCILKWSELPEGFEGLKEFFPQKFGAIRNIYPDNALEQIKEFYQYVKEDIESRYKDYDAIVPKKVVRNYTKRENCIYLADKNGQNLKREYNIKYFKASKYLFVTDNKEEYKKILLYVKDYIRWTKDTKTYIVEVIYCAKKYHKLFDNVITLEDWFKSSMFINLYRRHKKRENYYNYTSYDFLKHLKQYNKRLYHIYEKGRGAYNSFIISKGDELKIPHLKEQELIDQHTKYCDILSNNIYRKDKIINFLRNKLKRCK